MSNESQQEKVDRLERQLVDLNKRHSSTSGWLLFLWVICGLALLWLGKMEFWR